MEKIALAELIEDLRNELQDAVERGRERSIRFEVGEVTLELNVEVSRAAEGSAGLKFWVFTSAEAKASAERTQTQKITLTLRPKGPDGDTVKMSR